MPDPTIPNPVPDEELEETAAYDDATVGRAFRWSLAVFGVAATLSLTGWLAFRPKALPPPPPPAPLAPPPSRAAVQAEIPAVTFADITREAGIEFVHASGAAGEKLLPETMGGGVAFLDFDNDGRPDLLFVNCTWWPWSPKSNQPAPTAALYHNQGDGTFRDVTAGSGLDLPIYGMGVAAGDYDNDGWVDVLITSVGGNRLFRNLGAGKFHEVTLEAGVGGDPRDWSTCAAWVDYDNDGHLDLFVGNYVRWSREIDVEVGYKLVGIGRAYGQPSNFEGAFPRLFRNHGNGTFSDVSEQAGVQVRNSATGVPRAKPLGVAPIDLNGDGWIDLVVANDTVQNLVFLNRGDGTFAEIGAAAGIAFDNYGNTRGAMGIDAGHFRNDDHIGIVIGNFANEMTALYVAQHSPTNFADEAITEGIGPASRLLLKFGIFFFDYDLDGWLDVLSANGHLEEEISKIQASQRYAQPAQLFWNAAGAGQVGFLVVPPDKAGEDLFVPMVGRGSAFADIDGDGDLDVVLTQVDGPPRLLRNDQQTGHHWIRVKLVGASSNRDAIGTVVTLHAGGTTQVRQVMPTRSYLSQSELPVTFGLGTNATIDWMTVTWPGQAPVRMEPPPVNTMITVHQGETPSIAARHP